METTLVLLVRRLLHGLGFRMEVIILVGTGMWFRVEGSEICWFLASSLY